MKKITAICGIVAALAACNKDKFKTVPQVTISSITPAEAFKGNLITLKANITDKEGDQDSVFVVKKIYKTTIVLVDTSAKYKISDLGAPVKDQYDIQIQFYYGVSRPEVAPPINTDVVDRGLTLGLIIKDKAGNRSDYVESEKITLKKQ